MGLVLTDDKHYKAIAEKIRECLPGGYAEATYTPAEMPNGIDDVSNTQFNTGYDNGFDDGFVHGEGDGWAVGYEEGYDDGYSSGKTDGTQAEYDRWWDDYQQNGTRTDYNNGFGGIGWTLDNFKPKHDIKPTTAYMMFRYFPIKFDLVEWLGGLGVELDFSNCTNASYLFNVANVTRVGVIDLRSATGATPFSNTFATCNNLVTIDKIILPPSGAFSAAFNSCANLVDVTFEGVISGNGLNFQWSKNLSRDSMENIVGCLSTTTSGLSVTLSKTAVNADFTDAEWATLANTRSNWTINLV